MVDDMHPKDVLAANLSKLMEAKKFTQMKLGKAKGLSQATVGRVLGKEVSATIDTLSDLAKALGCEPWQLLVENLDPDNLPGLKPISKQERELYTRLQQAAQDLAKFK